MNKKRKPTISKESMGKNPFIANNIIKGNAISADQSILVEMIDGVNVPVGNYTHRTVVESQTYTKVWHDVDYRNIILGLGHNAMKLFLFIQYQLDTNEDYIWINSRLFQDTAYIKLKEGYREAVEELSRYAVICPTIYADTYWINPMIIFCGNRLKKYPENVKLRTQE